MAKLSKRQQQRSASKARPVKEESTYLKNVQLTEKQKELQKLIENNQIVICTGPAGTAKAQPLSAKILTPNGWTTMGKINEGDVISAIDGSSQTVVGVYPQGEKEVYEIILNDGSKVEATEDHLWEIEVDGKKKVEHTYQIIDRLDLGDHVFLPTNDRIEFNDHPIQCGLSPRSLGVIACKGIISKKDIILDIDTPLWVLEDLRDIVLRPFAAHHDANRFYGAAKTAGLIYDLKRINYSTEERMAIIQGAAEVSGTLYAKNHRISCISSYGADWLSDIARSLGYFIKRLDHTTIEIFEELGMQRRIKEIRKTDRVEKCQCIKVSSESSLYLTNDFVVTHNTYVSTFTALNLIHSGEYQKIILTKPAQESGEKLGFLPGDVDEKIAPYMESFITTMEKMIGKISTKAIVDKGMVECRPLAYMRGSTFDRSIMILDEAQNCDISQMIQFITRMGESSKVIICGDVEQYDVPRAQSGLAQLFSIISKIKNVGTFEFSREDIVRSKILIDITDSYHKWKTDNNKA